LNELQVSPAGLASAAIVVITATPVGKQPKASRTALTSNAEGAEISLPVPALRGTVVSCFTTAISLWHDYVPLP